MLLVWIAYYLLISVFSRWIISWGGASRVEGWLSFIVIGWFALDWRAEQIRLFVLLMWIVSTFVFIYGLFNPAFRVEYFLYH